MVPSRSSSLPRPIKKSFNFAFLSTCIVVEQAFRRLKMWWRVSIGEQQKIIAITARNSIACMVLNTLASYSLDSTSRNSWYIPVVTVGSSKPAHINVEIIAARRKLSHKRCATTALEAFNENNNFFDLIVKTKTKMPHRFDIFLFVFYQSLMHMRAQI